MTCFFPATHSVPKFHGEFSVLSGFSIVIGLDVKFFFRFSFDDIVSSNTTLARVL